LYILSLFDANASSCLTAGLKDKGST